MVDGQIAVEKMKQFADGPTIKPITDHFKVEKKNMTRDNAFKMAKKISNECPYYEDTVRLLEALGLIKFEELETAYQKLAKAMGFESTPRWIAEAIDAAGLKLVEK